MSGPSLNIGANPWHRIIKLKPDPQPIAIPPPFEEHSFRTPFAIPTNIYQQALDPIWPTTISIVYFVTTTYLNYYNRQYKNQPWSISKTKLFRIFVLLHNAFLAVYSGITCVAMVYALKRSIPHYTEDNALVGTVDALCKMHGPRGLGDAITYNATNSLWETKNRLVHLDEHGLPDTTDVGRIWNEGLGFWGWFFYLSKFYEVVDTAILLVKGKRSTTLQKYHHAGAMWCMWAGMRYMSPPIWMFVLVNSGIHTMMYTYYTLSGLGVRVPQVVKRTLTTLQITQFLVGASFAAIHLFVSYTVPVSIPYVSSETIHNAAAAVSSAATSAASSLTDSSVVAAATGGTLAMIKKLALRAAGEEGLAENIMDSGALAEVQAVLQEPQQALHRTVNTTVYRTEYQEVHCIDTTGQAFAIWLNLLYLAPLTGLFVRFFVKAYTRRTGKAKHPTKHNAVSQAGRDAAHGVQREFEKLDEAPGPVKTTENGKSSGRGRRNVNSNASRVGSLSPQDRLKQDFDSFGRKVSQTLEKNGLDAKSRLQESKEKAKEIAQEVVSRASTPKGQRTRSPDGSEPSGVQKSDGKSLTEKLSDAAADKLNDVHQKTKDSLYELEKAADKADQEEEKTPGEFPNEETKKNKKGKRKQGSAKEANGENKSQAQGAADEESDNKLPDSTPDAQFDKPANGHPNGIAHGAESLSQNGDPSEEENQGLSTTNPKDTGVNYADMMKQSKS